MIQAVIASTARIHPDAKIGPGVSIGEFCVVESDVAIGAGCVLEPYVYVKRWTTLGERNQISAGTVLGTDPLDKSLRPARAAICASATATRFASITPSRAAREPESVTEIGDENYIMTSGHIAHNCKIGNRTVICSCALVAGYVEVEDQAFISGGVVVHQYSKIGRLAMIGGNTRVNSDVPPFFLYSGFNVAAMGLNLVGLKRAGYKHRGHGGAEEGLPDSVPLRPEAGGGTGAHRNARSPRRRRATWWNLSAAASAAFAGNDLILVGQVTSHCPQIPLIRLK